ncbi:MAG: hypothetical protein ACTHNS_05520 [Marmoricola sp.]
MSLLRRTGGRPGWASDPSGERVLAAAAARSAEGPDDVWLVATRRHLAVVPHPDAAGIAPELWPWDHVRTARWDADATTLRLDEVGSWGEHRRSAAYVLGTGDGDGAALVQLVRERVTASVVLSRRVAVQGARGFEVVARRNPAGGPVEWQVEFDAGVEPSDPGVAERADAALASARDELGPSDGTSI